MSLSSRMVTKEINGKDRSAKVMADGKIIVDKNGKEVSTKYTTAQWKEALQFLFKNEGTTFGTRRSKNHIGIIKGYPILASMQCVCLGGMGCPENSYQMWNQNQGGSGDLEKYAQHILPNFKATRDMNELYDHIHFNPQALKPFIYVRAPKEYLRGFLCKPTINL